MAAPTAAELAQIRFYVPAEWTPTAKFSTGAVYQAWALYGTVAATSLALCRLKLAIAADEPDTFSVAGEYSQSKASAIAALRAIVRDLEVKVAAETLETTGGGALVVDRWTRTGGPKR